MDSPPSQTKPPIPQWTSLGSSEKGDVSSPHDTKLVVNCGWVIACLDRYTADELLPPDRTAVERHLCQCPTCADEAEAYAEVVRLAAALPPKLPPPDVEQRLRDFIAKALRATHRPE